LEIIKNNVVSLQNSKKQLYFLKVVVFQRVVLFLGREEYEYKE